MSDKVLLTGKAGKYEALRFKIIKVFINQCCERQRPSGKGVHIPKTEAVFY